MNKILVDTTDQLALPFNAQYISYSGQNTDEHIHDFIMQNLNFECENIIFIPIQLGDEPTLGLKVAMHIRCTQELKPAVRFSPIVLLYEGNTDELTQLELKQDENLFSLITQTQGVYLYTPLSALSIPEDIKGTNYLILKKELQKLPLFKNNSDHNHSIANVWGGYIFRGFSSKAENSDKITIKKLQFKYLTTIFELNNKRVDLKNKVKIKSDFNILLIDDHDDIWLPALQTIFEPEQISAVTYNINFVKYKQNIINIVSKNQHDIILLDLRLDKAEENIQKRPNEYSGFEILQLIKKTNQGTQVIIMTASNKAWNMKALMDMGADGYYVKEAPEYYDEISAQQNYSSFMETLEECADRVYLRKLAFDFKVLRSQVKNALQEQDMNHDLLDELMTFESSCISKTDMVMDLLGKNKSTDDTKYFRFAYLLMYQLLEEYTSLSFIYEKANDRKKPSKVVISSGKSINVFGPDVKLAGNIQCNFTFTSQGKYAYQTKESNKHNLNVIYKSDTFKIDNNSKSQTKETSLFRLLSVFKERHQYTEKQCANLIEMTYLRSNLCGHETGNIDSKKRDISKGDILWLVDVIMDVIV